MSLLKSLFLRAGLFIGAVVPLAACSLAPTYKPPHVAIPAAYKTVQAPFEPANPSAQLSQGPWWTIFNDAELSGLEKQLDAANPSLLAAQETYTQARSVVAEARSQLFPQLSAQAFGSLNGQSKHALFHNPSSLPVEESSLGYGAAASWEPDLWGEIRNRTQYAKANAQATAALVASAKLGLELELAEDYIELRGLDTEQALYKGTLDYYGEAVKITQLRYDSKIAAGLDLERAKDQLASAQAADTDVQAKREVLSNAIAVLTGNNPSSFEIPVDALSNLSVPVVPAGVPSTLLQRRPDIAAAERQVAAANAAVGVARAAFYPNIKLGADFGFVDDGLALAALPESVWSIGSSAVMPLFEGGLRRAEEQQSWSALRQATDSYRATVLQAFQEVEDQLSSTNKLDTESTQRKDAVTAALKVQTTAMQLYTSGLDNYLNVAVAQKSALSAELSAVELQTRRLQTAVKLVGALGGGWTVANMPTPDQTVPFSPFGIGNSAGKAKQQ
ncbi:efflux transporter outer membrane subunit [Paraburkholderia bannensis]|uniref:efflux transporter outer membrane subunit n=1 Tax=Paraburkholderia bannensis TaxID=765414 RepID=UPI002ABE4C8E|nr:efflux transporter outer membrane subunit [Paraburkholderia bannensis]